MHKSGSSYSCGAGSASSSACASTATASSARRSWFQSSPSLSVKNCARVQRSAAPTEATDMSIARVVTDDSFDAEVLKSPRPVIVEYWAAWCGPCRQVAPVLDSIAADYGDVIDLVKVNVGENPDTASKYAILHLPTVRVFP